MNPADVYSPSVWLPVGAAIFVAAVGLYGWYRRPAPGAGPFAVCSLFGSLWLLGAALEAAAISPDSKIAWFKFQVAWHLPAATAGTCFVLEYAKPGRWLTRRNLALLASPPLLYLPFVVTKGAQFIWQRLEIGPNGSVEPYFAPLGTIILAYAMGLALVNTATFIWVFVRSPQHRWPVALMLFGQAVSHGLYVLDFAHLHPMNPLDSTVVAIFLFWMTYSIALFGFRIFDPLPTARTTALAQMREGVVVCDARWRVLSLNPAAESILTTRGARADAALELLSAFSGVPPLDAEAGASHVEISRGEGGAAQHYTLDHQPLKDFRGLAVGHLLLLHDVTMRKQAEAQLLELQWTQATLQEREHLAQELHDSLSQSLSFVNLQAQAAQLYLQGGEGEAALASLARLAEVSRDLQNEMRELIGDLLSISSPSQGLCGVLRQSVARFEHQTGLAVVLEIPDTNAECVATALPATVAVQLLRIVQEALANVRRHAGRPAHILVRLTTDDGQLCLRIADNGAGFDPAQPASPGKHYGLQVMRQRTARIGGEIAVQSAPGAGTCVDARVPLRQTLDATGAGRSLS